MFKLIDILRKLIPETYDNFTHRFFDTIDFVLYDFNSFVSCSLNSETLTNLSVNPLKTTTY